MKHAFFRFSLLFALVLLVGAGCVATDSEDTPTNADMMQNDTMIEKDGDAMMMKDGTMTSYSSDTGVTLNVKVETPEKPVSDNHRIVTFSWEADEEVADETDSWYLAHGWEANPENPSTYRYIRGASHREWVWDSANFWEAMQEGTAHFRICALEGDDCTVYSNDVAIEIPGPTLTSE